MTVRNDLNVEKGKQGFQETAKAAPKPASLGASAVGNIAPVISDDPTVYVDPYPNNKGSDRVSEACGKCGGDGIYKAPTGFKDRSGRPYCFDCGGTGKRTFLVSSARQTARNRVKAAVANQTRVDKTMKANVECATVLGNNSDRFSEAWALTALGGADDTIVLTADEKVLHDGAWDAVIQLRERQARRLRFGGEDEVAENAENDINDAMDTFDHQTRGRFLPKMMGENKFKGKCESCGKPVKAGDGLRAVKYEENYGDKWLTFHAECQPTEVQ